MISKGKLSDSYAKAFGANNNLRFYRSPGRVNLIGEHTDYNGGYVLPCALNLGMYGAAALNGTDIQNFYSEGFGSEGNWIAYPNAVIKEIKALGYVVSGFNLYICADLPSGGGLSSSACLELLVATAVNDLFDLKMSQLALAYLCQRAEHLVGVNCGILDQFAVAMGRLGHSVLLNCSNMEFEYAPLKLGDYSIVIANTNSPHGLADSKYNERRSECEDESNPMHEKRMRHVVGENKRCLEAVAALKDGDLEKFGKLMNESHVSLRDDYEVTGFELDTIVAAAWEFCGCIGSRMTGGGFGGCSVNIVRTSLYDDFVRSVGEKYFARTGIKATFNIATAADGTERIYA